MLFKRHLQTCDTNYLSNVQWTDTAHLITAFGTDDTVQFFEGQRFSKSVFLVSYRGPPDLTDPKIFFTYDLRLDNFAVPVQETKYARDFIPLPMVKQKHHIYKINLQAFEPVITPHNITLVHPILVYSCGNTSVLPSGAGDCYGASPDFSLCSQVLVGWAVGGESYQFPNEAGISIGTLRDPQYIQLEIHYSNFDLLPGLIDSSGMRIYHMPELRKYDVGVLQTGVFIFPVHFIPPGAESYRSYGLCNSSQFDEMNGMLVPDLQHPPVWQRSESCSTPER
ncbi:putative DBH-like monooxygenase protein 2 [Columba livia]|uniref:Putative DBH-like monooxygenase protein 2 n=1 Tax=Columba livia TaxID=8932 RepID=A0A2I0MKK5_COLLI|nr:putative DBH-like monooxygenase protein 2 [Columba livia]